MKKTLITIIAILVILCLAQIIINTTVAATMMTREPFRITHYIHDGTGERPAETIPFGDQPARVITPTTPGFPSYRGPNTP